MAGRRAGHPELRQVREQVVPSREYRAMAGERAGSPELWQEREQRVPGYGR